MADPPLVGASTVEEDSSARYISPDERGDDIIEETRENTLLPPHVDASSVNRIDTSGRIHGSPSLPFLQETATPSNPSKNAAAGNVLAVFSTATLMEENTGPSTTKREEHVQISIWPEWCQCPRRHDGRPTRTLVVCIDGTANQFSFQVRPGFS